MSLVLKQCLCVSALAMSAFIFPACSDKIDPKPTVVPQSFSDADVLTNSAVPMDVLKVLKERAALYRTAVEANDVTSVVNISLSPTFINYLANMDGVDPSVLRAQVVEMMGGVMSMLESFSYDFDWDKAQYSRLKDGTQYVVLPTVVNMQIDGKKIQSREETFALLEDGQWYFMRVNEAEQIEAFKAAYPHLADINFSIAKMEVVE